MKLSAQGFTLIELMVVVSIIAILGAIGAVTYSNTQISARDSRRIQDVQEIQKAVEQYNSINSSYPNNVSNAVYQSTAENIVGLSTYFQSGKVPVDFKSGVDGYGYYYTAGANGVCSGGAQPKYIICAKLESCNGKCNRSTLPPDGCSATTDSGQFAYCVGP